MKKILILLTCFVVSISVYAHTPLLSVDDNEDGTIYVEGGFSNGASAGGVEILLLEDKSYKGVKESFEGKKILLKTSLGEDGSADIIKPNVVSYIVCMNAGPGHIVYKPGIKISLDEKEDWKSKYEDLLDETEDEIMIKWLNEIK